MFSLIITVISIALVAALAVASVYYGGPALSKGTARASAATIVSQGQQISGAATLLSSDNGGADVANLDGTLTGETGNGLVKDDYLTSVPAVPAAIGSAWTLGTGELTISVAAGVDISDICLEIEKNRNSDVDQIEATSNGGQFGCYMNDTATAWVPGTPVVEGTDNFEIYYSL